MNLFLVKIWNFSLELESKIASSREQIESMQTLNSEMKERQADLDLAIKGKLATYDQ